MRTCPIEQALSFALFQRREANRLRRLGTEQGNPLKFKNAIQVAEGLCVNEIRRALKCFATEHKQNGGDSRGRFKSY